MHNTVESKPYLESYKDLIRGGNIFRPFTLGLIPTVFRNMAIIIGC